MILVNIEGPLDDLRRLVGLRGIHLQRGVHDLGGGRWQAHGTVEEASTLDEIRARGLTVKVTMAEDEVARRVAAEREMMKSAEPGQSVADASSSDADDPYGSRKR